MLGPGLDRDEDRDERHRQPQGTQRAQGGKPRFLRPREAVERVTLSTLPSVRHALPRHRS